jgi:hypothetical protein
MSWWGDFCQLFLLGGAIERHICKESDTYFITSQVCYVHLDFNKFPQL